MYYYNNEGKTSSEKVLEHPELFREANSLFFQTLCTETGKALCTKKNTDKKLSNEQVK